MQINLIAVGKKMPQWINHGFATYAKRMPPDIRLNLIEIQAVKRTKNSDITHILEREGKQILCMIPKTQRIIVLHVQGKLFSTEQLAMQMQQWREDARNVNLIIGGPEGLSQECLDRAELAWSLSPLTLPHPLVRVIVAEQLYRAWSILSHHPYHRI
jgi:23S rRNA (pseudouridine1915-N3)-methyltransferase